MRPMAYFILPTLALCLGACGSDAEGSDPLGPLDDTIPDQVDLSDQDQKVEVSLIISELRVGDFVEFYNTSEDTAYRAEDFPNVHFAAKPSYAVPIRTAGGDFVVEAKGYQAIDWPPFFPETTELLHEFALFKSGVFDADQLLSYLCWTPPTSVTDRPDHGTKERAEENGNWSGDCLADPSEDQSIHLTDAAKGTGKQVGDFQLSATSTEDAPAP